MAEPLSKPGPASDTSSIQDSPCTAVLPAPAAPRLQSPALTPSTTLQPPAATCRQASQAAWAASSRHRCHRPLWASPPGSLPPPTPGNVPAAGPVLSPVDGTQWAHPLCSRPGCGPSVLRLGRTRLFPGCGGVWWGLETNLPGYHNHGPVDLKREPRSHFLSEMALNAQWRA